MKKRRGIPLFLQKYIDSILFRGRFVAMFDTHNRYKADGILYG